MKTLHCSPVEVFKGVGELQATEDDEGLQDLLQLLQRSCAAHSSVELPDLPVKVAGKLLTHLQRHRAGCRGGSPGCRAGGMSLGRAAEKPCLRLSDRHQPQAGAHWGWGHAMTSAAHPQLGTIQGCSVARWWAGTLLTWGLT